MLKNGAAPDKFKVLYHLLTMELHDFNGIIDFPRFIIISLFVGHMVPFKNIKIHNLSNFGSVTQHCGPRNGKEYYSKV